MGWEFRTDQGRVYGPYFISRANGKKKYMGRKPSADAVAAETQRVKAQALERTEKERLRALDEEAAAFAEMVDLLASGCLVTSGYYRHHREKIHWRKRQSNTQTAIYGGIKEIKMTEDQGQNAIITLQETQGDLVQLIQRGQAGDLGALAGIRELLDNTPALWQHVGGLATQMERRWLQAVAGDDLIAQEIWFRQLQALKTALAGPDATLLEQLLVERVGVCWLQLQDAELQAERYRSQYGSVPESYDNRITRTQKRFLEATKSFAQTQKLLRPKAAIVNIAANQQINIA